MLTRMQTTPAALGLQLLSPLLQFGRHLPFALQQAILEPVLDQVLAVPLAEGELDILRGRWLQLEVTDLGLSWCVSRDRQGMRIARQRPADACIAGCWRDFLLLASRQEDPDTLFFRRRLQLSGDTELGLAIKNLLDSLDAELLPAPLWRAMQALGQAVRDKASD